MFTPAALRNPRFKSLTEHLPLLQYASVRLDLPFCVATLQRKRGVAVIASQPSSPSFFSPRGLLRQTPLLLFALAVGCGRPPEPAVVQPAPERKATEVA